MTGRIIRVEPGTRPATCVGKTLGGSCSAVIYWVREYDHAARQTKSIPVDCDGEGFQRPSETADSTQADLFSGRAEVREGFGLSHFTTCPDRALIAQRWAQQHERQTA